MKSDFLWIYNNKLDVSDTFQPTITVSHRQHFCHFLTNSWLLRSNTQTHHLSPCVCARVDEPPRSWSTLLQVRKQLHIIIFLLIQPWISSTEVIKSNANKRDWLKRWYALERQKYFFTFHNYTMAWQIRLWRAATVSSMYGKHCTHTQADHYIRPSIMFKPFVMSRPRNATGKAVICFPLCPTPTPPPQPTMSQVCVGLLAP